MGNLPCCPVKEPSNATSSRNSGFPKVHFFGGGKDLYKKLQDKGVKIIPNDRRVFLSDVSALSKAISINESRLGIDWSFVEYGKPLEYDLSSFIVLEAKRSDEGDCSDVQEQAYPAINPKKAQSLARMVMSLFGHWKLSQEDQIALLGLIPGSQAQLSRYRDGSAIVASRDQYERLGHLLAIHKNLRLLFPRNRELSYKWITRKNKAFDGHSPVEVIRERGFSGLLIIRYYLDKKMEV